MKNIEQIVVAHGDIYIATASSAYSEDLLRKVGKAKSLNQPSFILRSACALLDRSTILPWAVRPAALVGRLGSDAI